MKMVTFFSALSLTFAVASSANAARQGLVKTISCFNSEMSSDEIKEASASFLGVKVGDSVSLDEVRKFALNNDGTPKDGMGVMETSSQLALFVKAAGTCQKDKTVKGEDGAEKTVSVVGTVVLTITK